MATMIRPLSSGFHARQATLAAIAIALSCAAAGSYAIHPSPLAPLWVGLVIFAAMVLTGWIRKPVLALYATLVVVFLPVGLLPTAWQSDLNRGLTVVAFSLWLFAVIVQRRQVTVTPAAGWMLAFLIWSLTSLFWARDVKMAWAGVQVYALRMILFLILIANQVHTRADLNSLMRIVAISGWILILTGTAAIARQDVVPGSRVQIYQMNENSTGIVASMTLVGVLWQTLRADRGHRAAATLQGLVFIVLSLALLAVTASRGSAISFLIMLSAFWLWRPTRTWGKLGLVIVLMALILAPFAFATLAARFAVERGDTFLGNREVLWQAAWRLILAHPWIGVGINNAPRAMVAYVQAATGVGEYEMVDIHNPVFTIWAETGVVGLLLYLGVLASAAATFVRRWLHDRRSGDHWLTPYYPLVAAMALGYLASWIKGGGIESDRTYFLLLALLVLPAHVTLQGHARSGSAGNDAAPTWQRGGPHGESI